MSTRKSGRSNAAKRDFSVLETSWTSARNKLIRLIIYDFLIKTNQDNCFVCKKSMTVDDWSIEHIDPWLAYGIESFYDLDNISFSHLKCNRPHNIKNGSLAQRKVGPAGTAWCSIHKGFDIVENFTKDKSRWNGMSSGCKLCKRNKEKDYYRQKKEE